MGRKIDEGFDMYYHNLSQLKLIKKKHHYMFFKNLSNTGLNISTGTHYFLMSDRKLKFLEGNKILRKCL